MAEINPTTDLPRAHGGPWGRAQFKRVAEDFLVDEEIEVPVHPTGAHWWLRIGKTGWNTRDVARALARLGETRVREVGYAGMKDRQARTRQWFSIPIAALDPKTLQEQLPEGLELIEWKRARHAIRRGGLLGNRFRIRLRNFEGDRDALAAGLESTRRGVPNYFGAQRFGNGGHNLKQARRLFSGELGATPRHERGLYLSAARSSLFNRVLAARVEAGNWEQLIGGEAVILDGSRSRFSAPDDLDDLGERLAQGDIHPSGPLVGIGEIPVTGACLALEDTALADESELVEGLCALGMRAERRALRLLPRGFEHTWLGDDLELAFSLPKGCYATAVLRELIEPHLQG
jgi:tRNA pseudouridine13 synthase